MQSDNRPNSLRYVYWLTGAALGLIVWSPSYGFCALIGVALLALIVLVPNYGYWLTGAALLVLIVLFVLPSTGGLARIQAGMLVEPPYVLYGLLRDAGVREIPGGAQSLAPTAITGSGYSDALVSALSGQPGNHGDQRRQRLHALLEKFPQHKSALYGHLLRYDTMGRVMIHRDAEVESYMNGKPSALIIPIASTPEALAAFNEDAAAGEHGDPDNAYFPLMHAVGLFAAHKDAEGLAEVERAGNMSHYDDYCFDEEECRWQLLQHTSTPIALARVTVMYSLLFPHYAQIRAAARFTTYKAVQAEVAGRKAEGFAIRQSTMHSGKLMRTQSRSAIGNLVGIAIEAISRNQPNGERFGGLPEADWNTLTSDQHLQRHLDSYVRYLEQTGHADAAKQAVSENDAGVQAKSIIEKGMAASPIGESTIKQLLSDWSFSMIALANALSVLILCIAMLVLKKLKQDQDNQPVLVVGTFCALFVVIAARMDWAPAFSIVRTVLLNLSFMGDTNTPPQNMPEFLTSPVLLRIASCFFSLLAPGLILVVLGVKRLACSNEPGSILARSLQTSGSIIALLLTLLYAYTLCTTAQDEAGFNRAADRMTQHEGKALVERLGQSWPH